jgi:pimeloyl-ACP methyl ester carboxylesterase
VEKIISHDGTPIAFYRSGSGPPFLLIQGTGAANAASWPAYQMLGKHFTVIAADRRGRGGSGDNKEYSLRKEFEDIVSIAEAIGGPLLLLGHSFGGLLALESALLSDRISKLVLYEPSIPLPDCPAYPEGLPEKYQTLLDAGNIEGLLYLHYREAVKMTNAEIEKLRNSSAWQERLAAAHTLPREGRANDEYQFDPNRFSDMKIPVLLLVGGDSSDILKKSVETLNTALPNSSVVELPGQQHIAMHTAPGLFVSELEKFLMEQD